MADGANLSQPLDLARLCRNNAELVGHCAANALSRLQDRLLENAAQIAYQLAFSQTPDKRQWLTIQLQATLSLRCERTLQPFDWPLDAQNRVLLVPAVLLDEIAETLPSELDVISLPEAGLSVIDLIEEELLLDLPLVPQSEQSLEYTAPEEKPAPKENPFAALAALKT